MGVVFVDTCETATGTAIGTISPDVGTGYTQNITASSGNWESDGDSIRHSTNVFTAAPPVKALFTLDDTPADNSECHLTFRLDDAATGDDPLFAVARFTDSNNFYGIGGYPDTTLGLAIFKVVGGTVTTLSTATGAGNDLKAAVTGAAYTAHVSDSTKELVEGTTSLLSTTDNSLTSGKYGFAAGDWLDAANDISTNWTIESIIFVEDDDQLLVFDKFRDADATLLSSHTPTPVGTSWSGQLTVDDTLSTVNSAFVDAVTGTNGAINGKTLYTVAPAPSSADYLLITPFRGRAGGTGDDEPFWIIARFTDTSNFYLGGLYPDTTGDLVLYKNVSGTVTSLASNTTLSSAAEGGALKFDITDALKTLTYSLQGTDTSISTSDNSLTSAGSVGIGSGSFVISTDDVDATIEVIAFIAVLADTGGASITVEQAVQNDSAQNVSFAAGAISIAVEQAVENDSVFDIAFLNVIQIEQAVEQNSAFDVAFVPGNFAIGVGQASEQNSAFDISLVSPILVEQAIETNIAFDILPKIDVVVQIEQARERNSTFAVALTGSFTDVPLTGNWTPEGAEAAGWNSEGAFPGSWGKEASVADNWSEETPASGGWSEE